MSEKAQRMAARLQLDEIARRPQFAYVDKANGLVRWLDPSGEFRYEHVPLVAEITRRNAQRVVDNDVARARFKEAAWYENGKAALAKLRDGLFPAGRQQVIDRGKMAGLRVPVQAIWGECDQILPVEQADCLPQSVKVIRYPDTGHMQHLEKTRDVNAAILRCTV